MKIKSKGNYITLIIYLYIFFIEYHLTYSSKNKIKNDAASNKVNHKSNKNIVKNFTCSAFENLIINLNSSNSSKKEKINNSPSIKKINNSNKTIAINNLKSIINNNISSEILTAIFKGIISLKKNDIFDYIIKTLKLVLLYFKIIIKVKKIKNVLEF